jgi:hypothetical protein
VATNDNMYDETIRRIARRTGIAPISFEHPRLREILDCFRAGDSAVSVILTGTAGDGKTHLCRQVWDLVGGDADAWDGDEPYLSTSVQGAGGEPATLHVIRDLSGWAPQHGRPWPTEDQELAQRFSASLFDPSIRDLFLIAANDGQLREAWRRLDPTPGVERARSAFDDYLVDDRQEIEGVRLRFYNLSRTSSAELFDRALSTFLEHPGWGACYAAADPDGFFGPECPIRHNYELLGTPLVQQRLRALLSLCDYNRQHIPIRHILLLLTNAVLGHPDVKDRLMRPADVAKVLRTRTAARASLYNNLFGGNLTETRRDALPVFDCLNRFRIGHETSNRIDNILIFGEADDELRPYFDELLGSDTFYGAGPEYRASQREYVEGADEDEDRAAAFLEQLVAQRRGLFFKIPEAQEEELRLWHLTVFQSAGEYLSRVVKVLSGGGRVERPILLRLVRGLNRVFTGMLVSSDRDLILATSLSFSQSRVSRLLDDQISVSPRRGEKVEIVWDGNFPVFRVTMEDDIRCDLQLHLTRFEFLSRVADGALPGSFSTECYEDMLAFKSQLLTALSFRRERAGEDPDGLSFELLELDDGGEPRTQIVEVRNG